MTTHQVEVETASGRGTVRVDGHDISNAVTGINVGVKAGELTLVILNLAVDTSRLDGRDVIVDVPVETAFALERLGWTPPPPP